MSYTGMGARRAIGPSGRGGNASLVRVRPSNTNLPPAPNLTPSLAPINPTQMIYRFKGENPDLFVKGPSGRRGFNGLGTCQWPQPGVPMVYPSCATDAGYQAAQAPSQRAVYTGITSVYDVPGLLIPAPSSCVDAQGNAAADPACVEENLRVQQENFRRTQQYNTDPAFRSQFVDSAPAPAGSNYAQVGPYPGAVPASGPIVTRVDSPATAPAQTASPAPAPTGATFTEQVAGYVDAASEPVSVGGFEFPMWGLIAAGVGALFLFGRRR